MDYSISEERWRDLVAATNKLAISIGLMAEAHSAIVEIVADMAGVEVESRGMSELMDKHRSGLN